MQLAETTVSIVSLLLLVVFPVTPVAAQGPFEDHKMHYPQLPNPVGWDVGFNTYELADDWLCTETGPVGDLHFWVSWQNDLEGYISQVQARIYADNPDGLNGWSEPADLLWQQSFNAGQFSYEYYDSGLQGWIDPLTGQWDQNDHNNFYQIDIDYIPTPFVQQEGTTYWLSLEIEAVDGQLGWKTSLDHWNDDAVYFAGFDPISDTNTLTISSSPWYELRDPITEQSLDFAFVITPEPSTLVLLAAGAVLLWRRLE